MRGWGSESAHSQSGQLPQVNAYEDRIKSNAKVKDEDVEPCQGFRHILPKYSGRPLSRGSQNKFQRRLTSRQQQESLDLTNIADEFKIVFHPERRIGSRPPTE